MLVLSRKQGEKIHLVRNGEVVAKIVIVETQDHRPRVGIDAPHEIEIVRQELEPKEKLEMK